MMVTVSDMPALLSLVDEHEVLMNTCELAVFG